MPPNRKANLVAMYMSLAGMTLGTASFWIGYADARSSLRLAEAVTAFWVVMLFVAWRMLRFYKGTSEA